MNIHFILEGMPKVSDEYLVERQEQILEAAIRCFARTGFHATGMAEIIRESDLSAGSVYRYYKSKDDLIAAIVERMLTDLQIQITEATTQVTTPGEAVTACIRFATEYLEHDDTGLSRVLPQVWTESLRSPAVQKVVRQKYGAIIEHFETLVQGMQQEDALHDGANPAGVAHLMLSTLQGFILQKMLLGEGFPEEAYLEAVGDMLISRPTNR